jgi:hypothetical protein
MNGEAPKNGKADVVPMDARKPKRPRRDGLTYTRQELAYVLGVSMRRLDDLKHQMPKPLAALSRFPRWSREAIQRWVSDGCRAPR